MAVADQIMYYSNIAYYGQDSPMGCGRSTESSQIRQYGRSTPWRFCFLDDEKKSPVPPDSLLLVIRFEGGCSGGVDLTS